MFLARPLEGCTSFRWETVQMLLSLGKGYVTLNGAQLDSLNGSFWFLFLLSTKQMIQRLFFPLSFCFNALLLDQLLYHIFRIWISECNVDAWMPSMNDIRAQNNQSKQSACGSQLSFLTGNKKSVIESWKPPLYDSSVCSIPTALEREFTKKVWTFFALLCLKIESIYRKILLSLPLLFQGSNSEWQSEMLDNKI